MAQPYSDDLRCKLLEAYEAGAGTLRQLAEQFRVSLQYAKKIRGQQKRTGQKQRVEQSRRGPLSRVTAEARASLRSWLKQQPDLTQAELSERLIASGVNVRPGRVGQLLREMELRRKKNPSTPPSATRKPTGNGVRSSPKNSVPSRRNG